jgi:hypothetical protein
MAEPRTIEGDATVTQLPPQPLVKQPSLDSAAEDVLRLGMGPVAKAALSAFSFLAAAGVLLKLALDNLGTVFRHFKPGKKKEMIQ